MTFFKGAGRRLGAGVWQVELTSRPAVLTVQGAPASLKGWLPHARLSLLSSLVGGRGIEIRRVQPTGPTRHRRAPSRKQPSAQVSSSSVMGTVSHSGKKSLFSVEGEFPKRELWAEGLGALDRGNWVGGLTAVFAGGQLHR